LRPTVSVIELIRFQFASTALTITLKAEPAVWPGDVPVFPDVLPGTAVSPRARRCSLLKGPAVMGIARLVLVVRAGCVTSEAERVASPAVLKVTLRLLLPPDKAAFAGRRALESLEVSATVSLVLTRFQLESTALTVTLKAVPAL